MNKLLLVVASASLLATSAASAGSPAIAAAIHKPRLAPIATSMPRIAPSSALSANAALPGLQAELPDWLAYDTQVYPREAQYWSAGNGFAAASMATGLATDANDPCGNSACSPVQNSAEFLAAEEAVASSTPGRAQTVVQGVRAPPRPATP